LSLIETFEFRGYQIPVRLCELTGGGPDTFEEISDTHIRNIMAACGLRSGLCIIEIGCGIGRDAIPLTDVLGPQGRYIGVDVISDSIRWCTDNITARHPNFTFVHQDIRDALHNPDGTIDLSAVRLPAATGCADLVLLQSVFTHMLADGVAHYLHEIARVLQAAGLVYATAFVVDHKTLESARQTNLTEWNLRFEHELGDGVYVNDPDSPTGAVAYRADTLTALADEAGLELVEPIRYGGWSGAHPGATEGQDILVLRRR
jgi:SAM-dependent methyltransferase